ncbi:hypothetical protein E2C01_039629 [Portunus trituberculatus]|uniref:Uncharacterized protein n=1 Tax=Portunus trituberculatus TaxID=210409 RepID=A0A5B7FL69_PORTR|nr:hypothetical protein [Portunus trituberculatus]
MPDTSTCPRNNSDRERFKRLARKNHDYRNDPHLSARRRYNRSKLITVLKGDTRLRTRAARAELLLGLLQLEVEGDSGSGGASIFNFLT